jgi:hypothetical protein
VVNLLGPGNAVLGSFAVNQATGQLLFMPATSRAGGRTTPRTLPGRCRVDHGTAASFGRGDTDSA